MMAAFAKKGAFNVFNEILKVSGGRDGWNLSSDSARARPKPQAEMYKS